MSIIHSNYIINNYSIDMGDGIMNTILYNNALPYSNIIPLTYSNKLQLVHCIIQCSNCFLVKECCICTTKNITSDDTSYDTSYDTTDINLIFNKYIKFKIYIGNNKLAKDNILISIVNILITQPVIYVKFSMNNILFYNRLLHVTIFTKTNTLINYCINLPYYFNSKLTLVETNIDIPNYILKIDLLYYIKIIKYNIKTGILILNETNISMLNNKLCKIYDNINTLNNQKLLEIKNNLINKFKL